MSAADLAQDLAKTIAPKSDQMNADDLIAGPRTIVVTRVAAQPSSADQPVAIFYEGEGGADKPYKPCKSMRRVLVQLWGQDGALYAGRAMTLYRDAEVKFGGEKVGGIRISHMSHIDGAKTLALTVTRGKRSGFTVQPLKRSSGGGVSAGADTRAADGVVGEARDSSPADDGFPGDQPAPGGFVFKLCDSRGALRETRDGDQWAKALCGLFAKAASEEVAADIWAANKQYVADANLAGFSAQAQAAWVAAGKRGVDVSEVE